MPDTLLGGIVINEILVDPNSASGSNFDTDGNGTAASTDEFVELYNSSNAAIDISGLELWDAGVGLWFTFPAGTILSAGARALVMPGVQTGGALPTGNPGDLFFDAGRGASVINNGGDNATLLDPSGTGTYIQATFNGDPLDDPTLGVGGYSGFPGRDLRVSQQHRILVEGPIAQRMFGSKDVLVPAKALLSLPGIYLEAPPQLCAILSHHA